MNFSHKIHEGGALKDDPYILSSQAQQVFYIGDENDKGWGHVIRVKPRDAYLLGPVEVDEELYLQCMPPNISKDDDYRIPIYWAAVNEETLKKQLCFLVFEINKCVLFSYVFYLQSIFPLFVLFGKTYFPF